MTSETIPVEHLFRLEADTVSTSPLMLPNGPHGTRMIATVTGGSFEGPKLKGSVANCAGGDWLTIRSDGRTSGSMCGWRSKPTTAPRS